MSTILQPDKYEATKETARRIQESTQSGGRRETSTGTPAGTKRNQQIIMMEQNPFPEERKKRKEGRQAPEPQLEPANHDVTKAVSSKN